MELVKRQSVISCVRYHKPRTNQTQPNLNSQPTKNVDTTKTITHVSLCSGYGGIDLGLRAALPALRTIAYCEREAFPISILLRRIEEGQLDAGPIHTDLKAFPWELFRDRVGILSGGYPCQPFSAAGNRKGKDDPRHLWPWIKDGIALMRPSQCFFENVDGHISMGLSTVISDLEELGYQATWGVFSASEVGAPHQRKRVFILADRLDSGSQGRLLRWPDQEREGIDGHLGCGGTGVLGRWPSRPGQPQYRWEPPRVVGNAKCVRLESTGDQGAVGETSGHSSGEGSESSLTSQVSSDPSGQRELADSTSGTAGLSQGGYGRQGSGRGGSEARQLGNSECRGLQGWHLNGSQAEEPGTGRDQQLGELGNPKHDGFPSSEIAGSPSEESQDGRLPQLEGGCDPRTSGGSQELGDTQHAGSHGTSFAGSIASAGNHDPSWENGSGESEGASRSNFGGDLQASQLADTNLDGGWEDRQSAELRADGFEQSPFDRGSSYEGESGEVGFHGSTETEDYSQIKSTICGDFDGAADRVGYAELCSTYLNRNHELRALGNGVVPPQCTHAYRTLVSQLIAETNIQTP